MSLLLIGSFYISKPTAGLAENMYSDDGGFATAAAPPPERPPDVWEALAAKPGQGGGGNHLCGNSAVEAPEQCDNGTLNGNGPGCTCKSDCTWNNSSSSTASATMAP